MYDFGDHHLKPVFSWANVCSPNTVRTIRRTLLRSQLACNEMHASTRTCGRRAADSMIENVRSSQYTLIVPHRVIQLTILSHSGSPRKGCASHKSTIFFFFFFFFIPPKRVKNLETPSSIFIFISSSSKRELYSQPIRGNVRRTGRAHVERSFLDPEYIFVAVRRILPTRFAKQTFAQLRTGYT